MSVACCVTVTVDACAALGDDDFDILNSFDDVSWLEDEGCEGGRNSPTQLIAGTAEFPSMYDQGEVIASVPPSTSSCGPLSMSLSSANDTQSQQQIPDAPDIAPLLLRSSHMSSSEQKESRVPTPPDITPLLKGALSSANIQLPLATAQPSSVSLLSIILTASILSP